MKRLLGLIIAMTLISLSCSSQVFYTNAADNSRRARQSIEKTLTIPSGTTPTLNNGMTKEGALFYRTSDSSIYVWTGTQWMLSSGSGSAADSSVFGTIYRIDTAKGNIRNEFWGKIGTSGTVNGTNFIGTTGHGWLEGRVNNKRVLLLTDSASYSLGNAVLLGWGAGEHLDTTNTNAILAIGMGALNNMRWGGSNIGIGFKAFNKLNYPGSGTKYASENIAAGDFAGALATTASKNAFFGHYIETVTGDQNSMFGVHAFESNYSGFCNSGVGQSNSRWNIRGSFNSNFGNGAGFLSSTVISSVTIAAGGSSYAAGDTVLTTPLVGSVIPGVAATRAVIHVTITGGVVTGYAILEPGNNYGYREGNDTLILPSATGSGAILIANYTSAEYNTSIGASSMIYNISGSYSSALGFQAGYGSGSNEASKVDDYSTFIGALASRSSSVPRDTKLVNATAIGYNSKVGASNSLVLGGLGGDLVNVGIGTSTPAYRLDVRGTFSARSISGNKETLFESFSDSTIGMYLRNTGGGDIVYAFANGGDSSLNLHAKKIIITDGSEGSGKVLTSDASGIATWQTPSGGGGGTPGGSNKQLQFNNSSSFAGTTGFEYQSGASPNVLITAQNAAYTPLQLKLAASHTGNSFDIINSGGTSVYSIDKEGTVTFYGGMTGGKFGGALGFNVPSGNDLYFNAAGSTAQLFFYAGSSALQIGLQGAGAYTEMRQQYGGYDLKTRNGTNTQVLSTSPGYYSIGTNSVTDRFVLTGSGQVVIGATSTNVASKFEVVSTTQGSMPFPVMTQAQRTAISSPPVGLHVYQSDGTEGVYVNKSTGWILAY